MGTFVLVNQYVTLNGTNLSDHVKSCTLTIDADSIDNTGQGSTFVSNTGGMIKGTLALELMDDYATSQVDSIVWSALIGRTPVSFEVRPDAGAKSTTNPSYTGNVLVTQNQVGGKLGDLASKSVSFPTSGTITRATA